MNSPLVSIVIPLYNKEAYIQNTLKSVLDQSLTSWECIIVDDGSTDDSLRLAKEFISLHKIRAKVVVQKNAGPSVARNTGIKKSSGSYIAFLDADDLWMPSKLEKQVSYMINNPQVDLCLTNYVIFNRSSIIKLKAVKASDPLKQIRNWLNMRGFGGLVESTGMIKRESIEGDLYFDPIMNTTEGLDFTLKWYLKKRIEIMPDFLTLYRISPNQLHTDVESIKKNVYTVSTRYPFLLDTKDNLDSYHKAYFELSSLRSKNFILKFGFIFKHLRNSDVVFFHMVLSIIGRNLKALIIPNSLRLQLKERIETNT